MGAAEQDLSTQTMALTAWENKREWPSPGCWKDIFCSVQESQRRMNTSVPSAAEGRGAGEDGTASLPPSMQVHQPHCKCTAFFVVVITHFLHTRSFSGVWRELVCLTELGQSYQSSAQPGFNVVRSYPSFLPHLQHSYTRRKDRTKARRC